MATGSSRHLGTIFVSFLISETWKKSFKYSEVTRRKLQVSVCDVLLILWPWPHYSLFIFLWVSVLQLWPGILFMKDFLPVEDLMALCCSGMLGMHYLLCRKVIMCMCAHIPTWYGRETLVAGDCGVLKPDSIGVLFRSRSTWSLRATWTSPSVKTW